jgi:hypothetical protein
MAWVFNRSMNGKGKNEQVPREFQNEQRKRQLTDELTKRTRLNQIASERGKLLVVVVQHARCERLERTPCAGLSRAV